MKKFWMISMLLIAALFVVSCGGDDEGTDNGGNQGGNDACTTQGAFRCSGDFSQKCDQEEWKNFEQCSADKPCNATTGKCEAKAEGDTGADTGAETGDTGADTGDTGADTGDTGDTGNTLNCGEIYQCMVDCGQDGNCQQGCYDKGSSAGQSQIMALINCLNTCSESSSTDEDFQNCANSQCSSEISNCEGLGGGEAADTSYNSPYGSLSLNFSVDQVANDSDGQQSTVGIVQAAFATGTYGNGSTSVTPADAYMIQSMAAYYQQSSGGQTYTGVQVQQIPVYVQGNQGVGGNPLVILDIPEENAGVGTLNTSLYQGGQAQLYVVDVDWNTNQISCAHAFGEGDVNITNVGDIAQHGALALNGNVTLYSPKNYDGNGDISGQLGIPACNPVQ